jgi:thymidylate kinase
MGLWKEGRLESLLTHVPGANFLLMIARLAARSCRLGYYRWRGRIVILDRFSYDAMLVTREASWRQRFTAALVMRMSRPPDLIVVLDLPGEVAFARKGEQDVDTLNEWRTTYRAMKTGNTPLVVLDATRPIEEVRQMATTAIWERVRERVSPHQS